MTTLQSTWLLDMIESRDTDLDETSVMRTWLTRWLVHIPASLVKLNEENNCLYKYQQIIEDRVED